VETGRRRARAQVVTALALLLSAAYARADEIGCAGDGDPPDAYIFPSGLAAIDIDLYPKASFRLHTARVALCGRAKLKRVTLLWSAGYEPFDADQRALPNAPAWGRLLDTYLGVKPFSWLTVYAGIRKLALGFAHDEPLQTRELPFRAQSEAVIPDRQLGLTLDIDFGSARLVAGAYESAPSLDTLSSAGLMIAARALIEPLGPVGNRLSTVADAPVWRKRSRFGLNVSFLYIYDWRNYPNGYDGNGYAIGGDVPFKWGPLGLVVEALWWSVSNRGTPYLFADGQFALMLWRPYLELSARWDLYAGSTVVANWRQDVSAGLTAYAWRSWVKIQLAYRRTFLFHANADALLLAIQLAR
jgi:hypothetical protein